MPGAVRVAQVAAVVAYLRARQDERDPIPWRGPRTGSALQGPGVPRGRPRFGRRLPGADTDAGMTRRRFDAFMAFGGEGFAAELKGINNGRSSVVA